MVAVPAGLNLTALVDVSALFDDSTQQPKRVTQTYDNTAWNRLLVHLPAGDSQKRRVNVVISLAELAPDCVHASAADAWRRAAGHQARSHEERRPRH